MSIVFNKNDTNKSNRESNQFNRPWTENEIKFVQGNMKKMTYKEMGPEINRTIAAIQSKVRYLPIKQKVKKYSVNNNYFKRWSEQMAYIIGFIASDGNICKSGKSHMLQLASDDRDIIAKIKKAISSKAPIHLRARPNGNVSFQLRFSDPIIYNDLFTLGIKPRKSLTLSPPKVPKKYVRHFLRGFFDGDGSVWISHRTKHHNLTTIFYTASTKMAGYILKTVKQVCLEFEGKIQKTLTPNRDRYFYSIALGHKSSLLIRSYMYKDATIYMNRKYRKFFNHK